MSKKFTLIIKNGTCFIDGKLTKIDVGVIDSKIKKIGKLDQETGDQIIDASKKNSFTRYY